MLCDKNSFIQNNCTRASARVFAYIRADTRTVSP
jgi:hypothetical protein